MLEISFKISIFFILSLSLNTTTAVAAYKVFNLCTRNNVHIPRNCVLKCRSRNTVFESALKVFTVKETADNTAGKAVAAAHTVNNGMNSVFLGMVKFLRIS